MSWQHIPVMTKETLENLELERGGDYLDATIGLGGHTELLLKQINSGRVIGLDADKEALEITGKRLSNYSSKLILEHCNFVDLDRVLKKIGVEHLSGIFADLGISSMELDNSERGFGFQNEGPLDMRLDVINQTITAAEIVNTYPEQELARIFREFADEVFPGRIARVIVERRRKHPITTTKELSDLILSIVPRKRISSIHPATRVFQALRIEVNQELKNLEIFLHKAYKFLEKQGRLVVISFHSGEDRIVKNIMREWYRNKLGHTTTKKPIVPSDQEISDNPRSRSAKMRVFVKN